MWWGDRDPGGRITSADRLIIRALHRYETGLDQCGHPRSESMDPLHDPANPDHVATYQTGPPFVCLACAAIETSQAAWAKKHGEEAMAGTKWVAELVPRGYRLATPT